MIYVSSRGNPWHDERGRFTSRGKAVSLKIGNEFIPVEGLADDEKKILASDIADRNSTPEYYKKQTGRRAIYADSISRYAPSKEHQFSPSDTPEQREEKRKKQAIERAVVRAKFDKENYAYVKRYGGKVAYYYNEDTGEASWCVYNTREIIRQATKHRQTKNGRLHKDTSTNMRTGYGYLAMMGYESKRIRSAKKGASREEQAAALEDYIEKHSSELAQKNVHLVVWEDKKEGVMRFGMSTWHRDEMDAIRAGSLRERSQIVNCETGANVRRNALVEKADDDYRAFKDSTSGSNPIPSATVGKDTYSWNAKKKKYENDSTGELIGRQEIHRRAKEIRNAKIRKIIDRL